MTPQEAIEALHALPLQRVENVPKTRGIYALADHEHRFRYIGSTGNKDFRDRIQNRHTTGSEENSHKFSWAYNSGRMWRDPHVSDPGEIADGTLAKWLRTAFIRRHCRAVWMPLEGTKEDILRLERAMIFTAPLETVLWNRERVVSHPGPEPSDLVDALIADLALDRARLEALDRQAARFNARSCRIA